MKSKILLATSIGNILGTVLFILSYVIRPQRFYSSITSFKFPEWLHIIIFGFFLFHPILIGVSLITFILSIITIVNVRRKGPEYGSMKLAILNLIVAISISSIPLLFFIVFS